MTHFYGNQDMEAARAGDAWAITRLGNKTTFSAEEIKLWHTLQPRCKRYGCNVGDYDDPAPDFWATDDANARRWCVESYTDGAECEIWEIITRYRTIEAAGVAS